MLPFLLALCQTIDVPGDYDSLLEATLAAPSGATILVHGGDHDFVAMDNKSLTLIAEPRARLLGAAENGGWTAPVSIIGRPGAKASATFEGFDIGGGIASEQPMTQASVSGMHISTLTFKRCTLRGFDWRAPASSEGLPGLEAVRVNFAELLVFEDCVVRGSRAVGSGEPAAAAVKAVDATVVVIRSSVKGGAASTTAAQHVARGGPAVNCRRVFELDSTFEEGDDDLPVDRSVVARRHMKLTDTLAVDGEARLGGSLTLRVDAPGWWAIGAYRGPARSPVRTPFGPCFVFGSPLATWIRHGASPIQLAVPAEVGLVGESLTFQGIDFEASALSQPATRTVLP